MIRSLNIREQGETSVPPQLSRSVRKSSPWIAFGLFALGVTGAVMFWFDPAQHRFYPFCFFHRLTGLQCPGCGGLRAVHQLLHGHLLAALHLNVLFVVSLPVFAWWWARIAFRKLKGQPSRSTIAPVWIWGLLTLALAFGVLRNLPAFAWLAP